MPGACSSSSSDEESSSSSSDESGSSRRGARTPRLSSKRRRGHARQQKMLLKPIPPSRYNGEPNANAIQRFAREARTYVKMGRVPENDQVYFISYYLDGKALDFYNQVVIQDEENWDLKRFFIELFEFCFPVDYRNKQRKRLDRCYQGSKDVAAHVAEWAEIYNTIGLEDTQEKIVKLFNSFSYAIQTEIYSQRLDPEVATWDAVVKAAEQAEVLEKIDTRNREMSSGSNNRSGEPSRKSNGNGTHSRDVQRNQAPTYYHNQSSRGGFHGRGRGRGGRSNWFKPRKEVMRTSSADMNSKPEASGKNDRNNRQPEMPAKKRNDLLAKGVCFICEEPGHLARNCPRTRTVPSKTRGKPPGISVSSAELPTASTSRQALRESTEVLESWDV